MSVVGRINTTSTSTAKHHSVATNLPDCIRIAILCAPRSWDEIVSDAVKKEPHWPPCAVQSIRHLACRNAGYHDGVIEVPVAPVHRHRVDAPRLVQGRVLRVVAVRAGDLLRAVPAAASCGTRRRVEP